MDFIAYFLNRGRCYLCNREEDIICQRCFSKLDPIYNSEYLKGRKLYSLYKYNQTASKILTISKYPPYNFFVMKYLLKISNIPKFCDLIITPVPLNSLKYYERGFNQAEIVSNYLSKKLHLPEIDLLKRTKYTNPLYQLNIKSRNKEVSESFKITTLSKLLTQKKREKVLLIDDLVTTGSTVQSCSKVLEDFGFKEVSIFSLFRA